MQTPPTPTPPFPPPQPGPPLTPAPPTPDKAIPALVLGIIGIVLCPICAPIAWSTAVKAEREIEASHGALAGNGMVTAARVLGIVGTILLAAYVVIFVVWFVFMGLLFGADVAVFDEVTQP